MYFVLVLISKRFTEVDFMTRNLLGKIGKSTVALFMVLVMLMTMLPMSVAAATVSDDEDVFTDTITNTATGFVLNKVYTMGLLAAGKVLAEVAEETGNEDFAAVVSVVNTWLIGKDYTKNFEELKALSNELLSQIENVNTKLDSSTADILSAIEQSKLSSIQSEMNEAWSKDVNDVLSYNGSACITNAFDSYFNTSLLDPNSNVKVNDIGYFPAAMTSVTGKAYSYKGDSKVYTPDEVEKLRNGVYCDGKLQQEGLKQKFSAIHAAVDGSAGAVSDYELFTDNKVDKALLDTLDKLIVEFKDKVKADYGALSAQYAYICYSDPSDQYEFIVNNISRQVLTIGLFEMMYQEFLTMRGEYLEENYPVTTDVASLTEAEAAVNEANKAYWADYEMCLGQGNGGGILGLAKEHKTFLEVTDSYLDSYFQLEADGYKIKLSEYPKTEDFIYENVYSDNFDKTEDKNNENAASDDEYENDKSDNTNSTPATTEAKHEVTLRNKSFIKEYTSENYRNDSAMKDYVDTFEASSKSFATSEYMSFVKKSVLTKSGVKICYALADNNNLLSPHILRETHTISYAYHPCYSNYPSCDYINLTKGTYSDGVNNFSCVKSLSENSSLFNGSAYKYSGSVLTKYLNLDKYYNLGENEDVYQIFPTYKIDYHKNAIDQTNGKQFNYYTTVFDSMSIGSANPEFSGYNFDIRENSGSKYTVILKNNSSELKNSLNFRTECLSGDADVDLYVKKADGKKYKSGSEVTCGQELTVCFNAPPEGYEFDSLKILRCNNAKNPTLATSEEVILDRYDFDYLKYDSETGYYSVDVSMPYSNCEIVLSLAKKTYVVTTENNMSDAQLSLDAGKNTFKAGENVYFRCDGQSGTVSIHYGENYSESKYIKTSYNETANVTKGVFEMPDSDVILRMKGDTFNVDSEDTFMISTFEDLCQMSKCVNGGAEKYTNGKYKLMNDIVIPDEVSLTPINNFNGTFEGNNCSIINLNTVDSNGVFGLFNNVKENAVIQNLSLTDVNVNTSSAKLASGALCVDNYGTIINCSTSGKINIERAADFKASMTASVGGICKTNNGKILNSHNDCSITWHSKAFDYVLKSGLFAGGICVMNMGEISQCHNSGEITYNGVMAQIGGLTATNYKSSNDTQNVIGVITDCYNVGNISVDFDLSNVDYDAVNSVIDTIDKSEKYDVADEAELIDALNDLFGQSKMMFNVGGLVGYDERGTVKNSYNYGDIYTFIVGYGDICHYTKSPVIENCYYLVAEDTQLTDDAMKHKDSFENGEVAYLLNNKTSDGTQIWYQGIDNGFADSYPVLESNGINTVYFVDLKNKPYSNYVTGEAPITEPTTEPATEPITEPTEPVTEPTEATVPTGEAGAAVSSLEKKDLRVYHRVVNSDGTVNGNRSDIYCGTGTIDNETKTITIKTVASVDKIGIMYFQGTDKAMVGNITLKGYDAANETSKEILESNLTEPDIYVDKNKCIFIKVGVDTSSLTLVYQQFKNGSIKYEPVEYKVKIEIVKLSNFRGMGIISSQKHYEVTDTTEASTEPTQAETETGSVDIEATTAVVENETATAPSDTTAPTASVDNTINLDASSTTDEVKSKTNVTASQNDAVKTGGVANAVLPISCLISAFVCLYIYKLKKTQ